jgi:hypothetical protein
LVVRPLLCSFGECGVIEHASSQRVWQAFLWFYGARWLDTILDVWMEEVAVAWGGDPSRMIQSGVEPARSIKPRDVARIFAMMPGEYNEAI